MRAKTKNITNKYLPGDGGIKTIPVHTPESGTLYIGGVSINQRRKSSQDVVNSLVLVIENAAGKTYALLNRETETDFTSVEQKDMESSDGARYHVKDIILSSSDTLKVISDVAPETEIEIDIRLSGFESTDR